MTPVYMPFTYLPESTARVLATLVGPVAIYQPLESGVSDTLSALASQRIIEVRTPLTGDEQRLTAALAEFTEWARMNPGKSTPGAGFFSSRQGEVPFFDENAISRLRSDIKQYGKQKVKDDGPETGFSARLFLAVAEENDRTTDQLDQDLKQFRVLEQGLLDTLAGSDEADFNRHGLGTRIWREDPGAKMTDQRIRAWATLAAADGDGPELLITTSSAVIDTLVENWGESISLEKLAVIRLTIPSAGEAPILSQVLAELAARQSLATADLAPFTALDQAVAADDPAVSITLYAAMNRPPASAIRHLAPAAVDPAEKNGSHRSIGHTLILLVQG